MMTPQELAARRKAAGLTLEKLAKLAGLKGGASHLWKIETGATQPLVGTWTKIVKALETPEESPTVAKPETAVDEAKAHLRRYLERVGART